MGKINFVFGGFSIAIRYSLGAVFFFKISKFTDSKNEMCMFLFQVFQIVLLLREKLI